MGERASKGLNRRFPGGIRVSYQEKPATGIERAVRQDLVVKAFASVLSGILGRNPTEEEILGLKPVTFLGDLVCMPWGVETLSAKTGYIPLGIKKSPDTF